MEMDEKQPQNYTSFDNWPQKNGTSLLGPNVGIYPPPPLRESSQGKVLQIQIQKLV